MKSKSSTKPIYSKEVEGAAGNITSAYNQAAPGLQAGAQKFGGIMDSVLAKYQAGDPNITAARGYNADVLGGKYLDAGNPYLQQMIDQTGNDVSNGVTASLGTRGLTGGSAHSGIVGRELAKNSTALRYGDYSAERDRMGQAVSQIPGLVAAENGVLDPAFAAYDAMQAPVRAAVGAGQGVGGLLGQYTKTTQKGSLAGLLAQMAGNAAQAYAGGG
ncbi:hypothetical protein CDQ92_13145 [Sphingopyxis bauzanensis]|uniref:Uncharacterized protein n=1 Tax=Sphingopyxis bauzanensis TaxID=651663 RepID=A0A246JRT6_9SPHN|nr:hypothetical protein [Sphingopyxis bauzanensis]OWQ95725.1 hypothetical protein CDQ92_13145 [Sphingopyxis bauzanensis]GGJ39491.1 hypothetical protein GCM10011393_07140 [Sphingopyxis bauzanensis]